MSDQIDSSAAAVNANDAEEPNEFAQDREDSDFEIVGDRENMIGQL